MNVPISSLQILEQAQQKELYVKVLHQLNKDLELANVNFTFYNQIQPLEMLKQLVVLVNHLLEKDFDLLINLLYLIDVPEQKLKAISQNSVTPINEEITKLIVQREWQKVWFKNQYR